MNTSLIKLTLLVFLLFPVGRISANAVVDQPFDEKIRKADLVVIGVVNSANCRLKGNEFSRYAVIQILGILSEKKGDHASLTAGDEITFVYRWGNPETDVASCCEKGGRYIFFLDRATGRDNAFTSSNGPYGVYLLADGQEKPGQTPGHALNPDRPTAASE